MPDAITLVLPTYNRAAALVETLPWLLKLDGITEFVVVDDGSADDTAEVVTALRDPRVRLLRRARNAGAPAARNLGALAATGDWVLFGEDDCRFPPDYATILRAEALAHRADIVGAPMVHPGPDGDVEAALAAARARRDGANGLDEVAGFPDAPLVTPLLPAPALVRRAVFDRVRFDAGYRGNAYREETDFFLRAVEMGFRCLLTPATFFWEAGRWAGGQQRPRAATEWWTVRNNWRFLRRHAAWLAREGLVTSPAHEQAAFVARRARRLARQT